MNLDNLVAIDVHTHAWKSALQVDDAPNEAQAAMGRYFRYQPQHQTVPEMAEMYRRLKMAFVVFSVDGEKSSSRKITNEEIAELAHQHADVAIPFASVNPHRGADGVRLAGVHPERPAAVAGIFCVLRAAEGRDHRLQ